MISLLREKNKKTPRHVHNTAYKRHRLCCINNWPKKKQKKGDSSSLALIAHFFSLVMIPYLGISITHYYLEAR